MSDQRALVCGCYILHALPSHLPFAGGVGGGGGAAGGVYVVLLGRIGAGAGRGDGRGGGGVGVAMMYWGSVGAGGRWAKIHKEAKEGDAS